MSKSKWLVAFALLSLAGCAPSKAEDKPVKEKYTATFLLNCKPEEIKLASGYVAYGDNLLFTQFEIEPGKTIAKPSEDPVRDGYAFEGWAKAKDGGTMWDFESDIASSSIFLYAKWGHKQTGGTYVEPEYAVTERIIMDKSFELTGILNAPIKGSSVNLTAGAIKRLEENKNNVNFALNYGRKEGVTFSSAYDEENKKVIVTYVDGESASMEITVNDITSSLSVPSNYEAKAAKYENNGGSKENYHIMLAGSSSMENWSTSTEDLSPIVSYNHGIGGTTAEQWRDQLAERLIYPYSPKCVVLYVGVNNIINSHDSGETTGGYCLGLFDAIHERLPNTKIFYVLINRLPGYASYQTQFDICNNMCEEYSKTHDYLDTIDAGACLLKANGEPNSAYFLTDGLHMSKYGYVLWGAVVKETLIDWMKEQ